jgi:hypothetical protein
MNRIRSVQRATGFGGTLASAAFPTLSHTTTLETIPTIVRSTPHIRRCLLYPRTHWCGPITGQEVRGRHPGCNGEQGTERAGVLLWLTRVKITNAMLGSLPFLSHTFPLERITDAFTQAEGDLAERLMLALEAEHVSWSAAVCASMVRVDSRPRVLPAASRSSDGSS